MICDPSSQQPLRQLPRNCAMQSSRSAPYLQGATATNVYNLVNVPIRTSYLYGGQARELPEPLVLCLDACLTGLKDCSLLHETKNSRVLQVTAHVMPLMPSAPLCVWQVTPTSAWEAATKHSGEMCCCAL